MYLVVPLCYYLSHQDLSYVCPMWERSFACVVLSALLYKQHSLGRLLHFLTRKSESYWPLCIFCSLLYPQLLEPGKNARCTFIERMNRIVLLYIKDNIRGSSSLRMLSSSPENKSDRQERINSNVYSSVWTSQGQWQKGSFNPSADLTPRKNHRQELALSPIPVVRATLWF